MTPKPLIYIALYPDLFEETRLGAYLPEWERCAVVERWPGPGSPSLATVTEAASRAEVLITGWGTPNLDEVLRDWSPETSPLRLVAHACGTVKYLLPEEAVRRGLLVSHANDSLAEAVAEWTVGAMIAMRRGMFQSAARYQVHRPAPPYQTMRELPGSVVGIVGASAIGRRVIQWLKPWQVTCLLFDPYVTTEQAHALGVEKVELLDLFRRCDIISLHAPITPETIQMLRKEHFAAMQDGALFINTARGVLVDHAALLEELQTGRISALLDVTDPTEPLPPDSPFFDLENCVLIQHQAGNSLEARLRQGRYTAEDVLAYLKGEPLRHQVRPERWSTMA